MSGSSNRDVLLAGAAAAFTVDLLIYPLDTLKTRKQSQDFLKTFADPAASVSRKVPSSQLFRGLYQGIGIVILATLPAAGTFFSVYEGAKTFLGKNHGHTLPQPLVHSAASAIAECASCVVLTPAEVIKQNAQMLSSSGKSKSSTSLEALKHLKGHGASHRLLSGYTAMVARNLPFTAIQFPIFEYARKRMWGCREGTLSDGTGYGTREKRSLLETGIITGTSAGLAGSFAAVVTTPMDVVKTRMMLMAGNEEQGRGNEELTKRNGNHGGLAVARQVIKERGVPGLFRGAVLRAVWTAIGSGLYLGMYEVSKVWLTRGKGDEDESFP